MPSDYVAPKIDLDAFNCPICGAFAYFHWHQCCVPPSKILYESCFSLMDIEGDFSGIRAHLLPIRIGVCSRCMGITLWCSEKEIMLCPYDTGNAPLPVSDMPEEIQKDYLEARSICHISPRGAAALLRLAIQKLCRYLLGNEFGKDLNKDIGSLVTKGLSPKIQQALDIVRVIGNNAVHPGKIQVDDDPGIVASLFQLVNLIVESQISQPKEIEEIFQTLPERAIEAIKRRDGENM